MRSFSQYPLVETAVDLKTVSTFQRSIFVNAGENTIARHIVAVIGRVAAVVNQFERVSRPIRSRDFRRQLRAGLCYRTAFASWLCKHVEFFARSARRPTHAHLKSVNAVQHISLRREATVGAGGINLKSPIAWDWVRDPHVQSLRN